MSAPIKDQYDVVVVGAGPAGMAAASLCARHGLDVAVFDEQASPGGQIYRAITETPLTDRRILGADYWNGEALAKGLSTSPAQYVPNATVWSLTPELEVGVSVGGGSKLVQAKRVILATGALERPFPIPGWTLPGVMTAGAAQTLFKTSALVASGRTVLAGTGPLLWLLAWQYLNAGVKIDAILDTTPRENRARARPHLPGFLFSPYFRKGVKLLAALRGKVRVMRDVVALRAEGTDRVERIALRTASGMEATLPVDTLLLHQGVVPNVNLAMAAGVEHRWDDVQLCWSPLLDREGGTSIPGVAIAGDGAGIGGGQAAAWRGVVIGMAALRALRPGTDDRAEKLAYAALRGFMRGRGFIDRLYRPARSFRIPRGDTIVCRCEEVTAQQVVDTVKLGCPGPNQMKSFLRCGMGPCQGRLCGLTVTELMAEARGVSAQEIGYYRLRPPVKPITVAELASLPQTDAAVKAVVRV